MAVAVWQRPAPQPHTASPRGGVDALCVPVVRGVNCTQPAPLLHPSACCLPFYGKQRRSRSSPAITAPTARFARLGSVMALRPSAAPSLRSGQGASPLPPLASGVHASRSPGLLSGPTLRRQRLCWQFGFVPSLPAGCAPGRIRGNGALPPFPL